MGKCIFRNMQLAKKLRCWQQSVWQFSSPCCSNCPIKQNDGKRKGISKIFERVREIWKFMTRKEFWTWFKYWFLVACSLCIQMGCHLMHNLQTRSAITHAYIQCWPNRTDFFSLPFSPHTSCFLTFLLSFLYTSEESFEFVSISDFWFLWNSHV